MKTILFNKQIQANFQHKVYLFYYTKANYINIMIVTLKVYKASQKHT